MDACKENLGGGHSSSCSCYHAKVKSTPRFHLRWEFENMEIGKTSGISENEGYLENYEVLSKQNQPSDEAIEMHFEHKCELN